MRLTTIETFLHWYMIAFFLAFGWYAFRNRACFSLTARPLRRCGMPEPYASRLNDAIERRDNSEHLHSARLAIWTAGACLVAALVAAFTAVPLTLLYAGVCLVLAGTLGATYLQLRRTGGRRVASLRPRRRDAVLPNWLFAAVAATSLAPLAYFDVAPVAAVLVTLAAASIVALGSAISRLPARLSGGDPAVDAYVDDRLRALRAVNIVATASAPAYVFTAYTLTASVLRLTAPHIAATFFSLAVLLLAVGWQVSLMRRGPARAEMESWAALGV